MKSCIFHGQLQDCIDYKALIEMQANKTSAFHVVATRKPQKCRKKPHSKVKKYPLKYMKR